MSCASVKLGAMMANDEVLVALISESLNAETRHRRIAALVLVEVLRNGRNLGQQGTGPEVIPVSDAVAVADEVQGLIVKYRLGGADAPLGETAAVPSSSP